MGGCSSKPQTAESEGLLDPPPTKQELDLLFSGLKTTCNSSPYQAGSHHNSLKNLFSQHGKNGEDVLEDAQTLHDLLLHAVDSKSLSNFENLSAGNAEAHPETKDLQPDLCFSCKQSSPLSSAVSTSTEKTAEKWIKLDTSMPNLTEENDENCANLEGAISNPAQDNADKCAKLGVVISNSPDENTDDCAKLGSVISNSAGENADNCAKLGSVISNLAGENADKCAQLEGVISDNLAGENTDECAKSGALISNLEGENTDECAKSGALISNLEGENADRCANLGAVISNLAGENAEQRCRLEAEISSRGLNVEPTSDLDPISESESGDREIKGLDLEPKSDLLKISEPNFSESIHTEAFNEMTASEATETEAGEVQNLNEKAMEGKVHAEKAMEDEKTEEAMEGKQLDASGEVQNLNEKAMEGKVHAEKVMEDEKTEEAMECKQLDASGDVQNLNEKAMEGKVHAEKAMDDKKIEEAMEGKQLDVSVEKAMDGEITEKAMEAEEKQMQFEKAMRNVSGANSLAPCKKALKCDASQEKVEKAMACQKAEKQAEKAMEVDEIAMGSERTGVQVDTVFDGEKENGQEHGKGDKKDENAVRVMQVGTDGEKTELQNYQKAGVQDRETGAQVEKTEVQVEGAFHGEKAKTVCVEKGETMQDGEKAELPNEMRIGVHNEKTGAEIEKAEVQDDRAFDDDEKAKAVYVEKAGMVQEDDRAFDDEKAEADCVVGAVVQDGRKAELRHEKRAGVQDEETGVEEEANVKTKAQDEEKAEDELSPSQVHHAFASESTCSSEHSVADACPDPLSGCTELPMVVPPCGPVFELAPKENTIEAADLGFIGKLESEQKKLAAEENTVEVAVFVPLESNQKMLASEKNTVDPEYVKHIEKPESEEKKTEQSEKKKDDMFAAQLHATECKTENEALLKQSSTDGNARDTIENNSMESPSRLVVEHGITSDDYAMRADINVAGADQHGFVQGAHEFSQSSEKLEPPNCGHNQTPIIELDLITSKHIEAEQSPQMQVYDASALHPPLAESSLHANLSCPDLGVDNGLVDISATNLLTAKLSVNEGVESKPRQEHLGGDLVKASDNVNILEEKDSAMIKKDEVMAQIEAPK